MRSISILRALCPILIGATALAQVPALTTLQPGAFRVIPQNLPVNIVFVGYEEGAGPRDINRAAFLAPLASTSRPRVFMPNYRYGIVKDLGLSFNYQYNLVFANNTFEDAFFGYLNSIAVSRPVNPYQNLYNTQTKRSLNITDNATIDAHLVEKWLAENSQALLGVDTRRNTVFFINWYGRPNFRHHAYTVQSVDIDTGMDWGVNSTSQVIAYGGTAYNDPEKGLGTRHRIWFHDLSAGPEWNTVNWLLDDGDVDGDGAVDYRMPPVWEYGNLSAYRPFNDLSGDLAKLTRYVALDLLFTTSPVYNPSISGPKLPKNIQVDVSSFEGDPNSSFASTFNPAVAASSLNKLQSMNAITVEHTAYPLTGRVADIWGCYFYQYFGGSSCYGRRLWFGDLFNYYQDHLNQYLEYNVDYEVPVFALQGTTAQVPLSFGFADDNWKDGTQSMIFIHQSPFYRQFFGYTGFVTHETGHHLGLSHPHDGYDSESGQRISPANAFYFAWAGDASNSVMSYQQLETKDFSQFDQDNMHRWLTAAYVNEANRVLAAIAASPRASQVAGDLQVADGYATASLASYGGFSYETAAFQARQAYDKVMASAARIGVAVEPEASQSDYNSKGTASKFKDIYDSMRRRTPNRPDRP